MEQIYASNCSDKQEMVTWENTPVLIKDDYNQAKLYFETLVKDFETYTQTGYKSTNQTANVGDEIRKYIQEIASATVADKERMTELAANISNTAKVKEAQIDSITAQIKLLTDTVALLSKLLTNKENNGNNGSGGSGSGSNGLGGGRDFKYTRNMGNYCWSHDHHPVGAKHTSIACTNKKEGHQDAATATNCMGGDNFWPGTNKVRPSHQGHASCKGKSTPN